MLNSTGRGTSPINRPSSACRFSLLSTLPHGMTYTRNDTAATYRDSSGFLRAATAHQPRFNHDSSGNVLGLLIEAARQNKCTNTNASPTVTTGLTTSAGTPVVSIVDDTAALAAAGLHLVGNAKVIKIDNSANATTCSVDFPGTCGNTNAHSFSVWARETASTHGDLRRTGSGTGTAAISGANYARYKLENETPSSSSNQLRVRGNANSVIYCVLNQLEEGAFVTSEIVIAGGAATRQQDDLTLTDLDTKKYFSETQGFIAVRYRLDRAITGTDQYVAVASNGTSAETLGMRIDSTSNALRGYVRNASINRHTAANGDDQLTATVNAAAVTWQGGEAMVMSGGLTNTQVYSGDPAGINLLRVGALSATSGALWGHIRSLKVGRQFGSAPAIGSRLRENGDLVVIGGGQSLMVGHFDSQESGGEDGKQKFRETASGLKTDKTVVFVNGGMGASAASKTTQDPNYWWDLATSSRGDAFDAFYDAISDAGIKPTAIIWAQGEQDAHQIGLLTSRAQYKQALEAIFADMREMLGDIPVFIQKVGRRTVFSNTGGLQAVREVQQEIIDENSWCYFGAESFDQALHDTVHLTDAGYIAVASRLARQVAKYFGEAVTRTEGPHITGAVRTGTSVAVTIAHDAGNTFTPTTAIEGFYFFDNTSEIAITAAVRTNATTITLTLNNTPFSGIETLYYVRDAGLTINPAKLVADNAAIPMPLRAAKIIL